MIGGRRTLQTYIATIKHDYLLFVDSIISSSRRENTTSTDSYILPPHVHNKININEMKHQTTSTAQHSSTTTAPAAVHPNHKTNSLSSEKEAGTSANAGPHYQKLYARVTHIWGNRTGEPDPSAMKGPHLRGLNP